MDNMYTVILFTRILLKRYWKWIPDEIKILSFFSFKLYFTMSLIIWRRSPKIIITKTEDTISKNYQKASYAPKVNHKPLSAVPCSHKKSLEREETIYLTCASCIAWKLKLYWIVTLIFNVTIWSTMISIDLNVLKMPIIILCL